MVGAVARHPWVGGGCLLAFVVLGLRFHEFLVLALVPVGFLGLALLGYFASACRYIAGIRARKPRCLSCKTVIWQVKCGFCLQPVPMLTLLFWGRFLSHCPHCGEGLSEEGETLRAWCHDCGMTLATSHLRLRNVLSVELGADRDKFPPGELHFRRNGSYLVHYRKDHSWHSIQIIPDYVLEETNAIWFGSGVNSLVGQEFRGRIPKAARRKATLLFEDSEIPPDVSRDDWGGVKALVPRPSAGFPPEAYVAREQ